MKKILALIIVLCIIAAGLWYFQQPPAVRIGASEYLPRETLFVIEIHELEKAIKEFKESRLGKNLGSIDIAGLMEQLGAKEEDVERYREGEERFFSALDSRGTMELFGKELHLALLPVGDSLEKPEDFLEKIMIIAYPKRNPDFLEVAGAFFTEDSNIEESAYEGHTIKSIKGEDDLSMHYCFTEGIMLASFGMDPIKGALDRRKSGEENLSANDEYRDLRQKVFKPRSRTFAYLNIGKIGEDLKSLVLAKIPQGEGGDKEKAALEKQLDSYGGFKSVAYSSYGREGDELSEKVLITLDGSKLTAGQKASYLVKPGENNTLSMIPGKTIFYNWANNLEIKHSLNDYLFREGMTEEGMAALNKKIEEIAGATIDEIDETLGGEIAIMITDVKTGGLFPVPVFALMAQVKGTELVEDLILSLVSRSGMALEKEVHESVEIKHLMLPFGSDIQPAYTFYDGFWIVAVNPGLIKEMMAAKKSGRGISSEEIFKSVDKGLSGKNNSISYIRMDQVAEKMGHLAQWGKNMLTMESPEAAEKGGLIVKHLVDPFLEGLKMYKAIGTRTFIEGETIEVDSYCKVESKVL
ncbi:MAG: hypothetical protein OEV42_02520 [Deltaproteobacteria bacterium]|nr:hypothetical protein [Deltaproteobacteria bacterium]